MSLTTSAPPTRAPGSRGASSLRAVVGSAVFVVAAVGAQLLRQAGTPMWRTVWAEDGTQFLAEALDEPLHEIIFRSYAGYGHVWPRILAEIGSVLPPEQYARWAVLSSTGTVALLALFVYWASAPLLRAPIRQGILACSMVLLPVLPLEILGAICNIHWILPLACLVAVLLPVDRPWAIAARLPIVVLGPLSSPLCLAFAPIVVVQLVVAALRLRRGEDDGRPARFVVPVAYLVAVAGQLAMYAVAPKWKPPQLPIDERVEGIVRLYPTRVVTNLVFGVTSTERLWADFGWAVAVVACAFVGGALVWKLVRSDRTARLWILALVAGSGVLFAYSMWSRSELIEVMIPLPRLYNFLGARYEVFPAFLVVLALLLPRRLSTGLLVTTRPRPPEPELDVGAVPEVRVAGGGGEPDATIGRSAAPAWWRRFTGGQPWVALTVITAVWAAVALVPSYRLDNGRSPGPAWGDGFYEAVASCESDAGAAVVEVEVPISPHTDDGTWRVTYTCAELGVPGDSQALAGSR